MPWTSQLNLIQFNVIQNANLSEKRNLNGLICYLPKIACKRNAENLPILSVPFSTLVVADFRRL